MASFVPPPPPPQFNRLIPKDTDQWNVIHNPVGNAIAINNDECCAGCGQSNNVVLPPIICEKKQYDIGALLGNGKIALVTDTGSMDVAKTMIATELKYSSGSYKPNVIEPFHVNRIKFFSLDSVETSITSQSLDMKSGVFTGGYNFTSKEQCQIQVVNSLLCPRPLPFCIMQCIEINPVSGPTCSESVMDIPVFHEVFCHDNIREPIYNNNVIYNANGGLYVLNGMGYLEGNKQVAFASCYLGMGENTGFNVFRNDSRRCYNSFIFKDAPVGVPIKAYVFTAMMTDFDFDNPLEEVKRIVIAASQRQVVALSASMNWATKIRSEHVLAWSKIWETCVTVRPKDAIDIVLEQDVLAINQLLKGSLYHLYCCMRENVNMEINALNLSFLDQEGFVMYDGDVWLTPLMLILKPDTVRPILEYRYKTISQAQQISAGYGFNGGKFPYTSDVLGYKNALYYDTASPLHVFNNALVAINVWNYFRISKDREWLSNKGYAILKSIADFFISAIEHDEEANTFVLPNTVGLNGTQSVGNNSFTNNMVRLALRYATEGAYELQLQPRAQWQEYYFGLPIVYQNPDTFKDIVALDESSSDGDDFAILEMLFVLIPNFSQLYFHKSCCTDTNSGIIDHDYASIKRNLDYYIDKIKTSYASHPYNVALLAIIYGIYAQYDPLYTAWYDYYLHKFIDDNSTGNWCGMKGISGNGNSIIMNAIFVLILTQGMSQLKLVGGVAETRFYYEELKLSGLMAANMPEHWNGVRVSSVGVAKDTFNTMNQSPC